MLRFYTKYPVFLIEFILTVAGLVLIIVFWNKNKDRIRGEHIEEKMFRYLTITAMVYAILGVIKQIAVFNTGFLFKTGLQFFTYHIQDAAYLVYTLMWVIFVDAVLYRSTDGLKRRYRLAFVPYAVMLLILVIAFIMEILGIAYGADFQDEVILITGMLERMYFIISFFVGAAYMIYAFRLARVYQKEIKQPVFLRLDVFIIPWAVGFLSTISYFLSLMFLPDGMIRVPDLSVICAAISLILTFRSMRNRYLYVEYDTGFYKEEFMDKITEYMDRHHMDIHCGLALWFSKERDQMAKVLAGVKPDRSSVISLNDGSFLLLSDVRNSSAVRLLLQTLRTGAAVTVPGTVVVSKALFRYMDEPVNTFKDRVLKEFRMKKKGIGRSRNEYDDLRQNKEGD